jgi:hypothetical protein
MSKLWKISLAVILLYSNLLIAQERGQYVPGFAGLNSGVQAPAGFDSQLYCKFWQAFLSP